MPHTAALSTGHSGRKAALPRNWMECLKRGHRCHNPEAPSPWLTLLALRRAGVWTSVPVRGQWDERRRNRDTPVSPTISHPSITDKTWMASLQNFTIRTASCETGDPPVWRPSKSRECLNLPVTASVSLVSDPSQTKTRSRVWAYAERSSHERAQSDLWSSCPL